jgi:cardiolipin synthase A/B
MTPKAVARRATKGPVPPDRAVFRPADRKPAVLGVIRGARRRLALSMFRCDDFDVLDALAAALGRGVRVDVLLTGRARRWRTRLGHLWQVLESMGATLHRFGDPVVKYHAKYLIADDDQAVVTSLNLTRECFTETVDFVVVTRDRTVVGSLTRLFDADCRDAELAARRLLSPRLIVGPQGARERFTALLRGARRRIALVDHKLTDPAMLELLRDRERAGIRLTVLGRSHRPGLRPHGKLLIVDDRVAVVGSLALSALSLDFRREVALVVRDRACVAQLVGVFQQLEQEPPVRPGRQSKEVLR